MTPWSVQQGAVLGKRPLVRAAVFVGALAVVFAMAVLSVPAANAEGAAVGTDVQAAATVASESVDAEQQRSMGFIGCSMAENVAQGYVAIGGTRMWGPYGTGGAVVQSWTDPNSSSWQRFDQQAAQHGTPSAVWIQICIFGQAGATYQEVQQLIANTRLHTSEDVTIYITGQPLYDPGRVCFLAGQGGPELTDGLAQQAAADVSQNVTYSGTFHLAGNEVADGCHANAAGQRSLGQQALDYWG